MSVSRAALVSAKIAAAAGAIVIAVAAPGHVGTMMSLADAGSSSQTEPSPPAAPDGNPWND